MEGVAQTQLEQHFHLASTSNLPAPLAESFLIQGLVAPDQLHQGNIQIVVISFPFLSFFSTHYYFFLFFLTTFFFIFGNIITCGHQCRKRRWNGQTWPPSVKPACPTCRCAPFRAQLVGTRRSTVIFSPVVGCNNNNSHRSHSSCHSRRRCRDRPVRRRTP
jgi:hypothetical protein